MRKIKNIFRQTIFTMLLLSYLVPTVLADDDQTFRGNWWNYYDRAIESAEQDKWDPAVNDLSEALSVRGKEQRMARTYGMHFIDYFPHREIGIIYLNRGQIEAAISELEKSLGMTESAKAAYYLNKARSIKLRQTNSSVAAPEIVIAGPPGNSVNTLKINISGTAKGEGLVSAITVNGSPFRFDIAKASIEFNREVILQDGKNDIIIRAEDLLGKVTEKKLSISLDREGPIVSIFDVTDGKLMRVRGEVADETGIAMLAIGGKDIDAGRKTTCEFDVPLDGKDIDGKTTIKTVDLLGNETEAQLDIKKEVAEMKSRPEPLLLAFNSDTLFSSDKAPPVITLKDEADLSPVFVEKYYVDGYVSDNGNVERIVINNSDVLVKNGRKIIFGKTIDLREGKNRVLVEAFDGAGNRSAKEFYVTRVVSEIMKTSSRMRILVLPFDEKHKAVSEIELGFEYLIGAFIAQKRFSIVEREKLEQVLLEQKLTMSQLTDPLYSIKIRKLLSAQAILSTAVSERPNSVEAITRVIDTETSEEMEVKDVYSEDKSPTSVKDLMAGLAAKVAAAFPVAEGMVIKRDGSEVNSDIGAGKRLRKNTEVIFFRKGVEQRHPVTGKSLGWDIDRLGEGRVEEVYKEFSKMRLLDKPAPKNINVKDLIITK